MSGKFAAISSILFSGALALYANAGWSQQNPSGGTGGQPPAAPKGADPLKGNQSGTSPSSAQSERSGSAQSGAAMQRGGSSQSEMGSSAQQGRSGRSGMSQTASGKWSQEEIKEVQEALKKQGHDPGAIDGVMGPNTRQALRAFQKSKNMQATGQLNSETASALGVSASGMSSSPSGTTGMGSSSGGTSSGMSGSSPSGAGTSPSAGRAGSSASGTSKSTGGTQSESDLGKRPGMPESGTKSSAPGSSSGSSSGSGSSTGSAGSGSGSGR